MYQYICISRPLSIRLPFLFALSGVVSCSQASLELSLPKSGFLLSWLGWQAHRLTTLLFYKSGQLALSISWEASIWHPESLRFWLYLSSLKSKVIMNLTFHFNTPSITDHDFLFFNKFSNASLPKQFTSLVICAKIPILSNNPLSTKLRPFVWFVQMRSSKTSRTQYLPSIVLYGIIIINSEYFIFSSSIHVQTSRYW